ncbi:MAG: response regulator, partial [Armatimonadota bacterium]
GLGLSTVYGIVRQSGGNIWVYSEVGKGTTFKVYLPAAAGNEKQYDHAETTEEVAVLTGNETVLIVEDEDTVRFLARQVLEAHGYTVLTAESGADALTVSDEHSGTIHLLLTDVVMPGLSGKELADELCRRRPGLQVLYMSGYTDNAIVHHGVLDAGIAYIQKPFAPMVLATKVRSILDRSMKQAPPSPRKERPNLST